MNQDRASDLALESLQWIAGDSEQLSRFVALTGVAPDEIRLMIHEAEFQSAILEFLLGNEPTLLAFAASKNLDSSEILKAKQCLAPDHAGQDDVW